VLNTGGWVFDDAEPRYTISLCSLVHRTPATDEALQLRGPYASLARFESGVAGSAVRFRASEVLGWTDTAALPLLPSEKSAEVFLQLRKAPRLDLDDGKSWRARPYAELHATNDKKNRLMILAAAKPSGTVEVFKGESFDIWEPDTGTYYAFAKPDKVLPVLLERRLRGAAKGGSPFSEFEERFLVRESTLSYHGPRVAFRDVSRSTDSRTVRAALIPAKVFLTNKGPFFLWPRGDEKDQAFLLGVLCSIPLDWYARRFVETNLNYHILNAFPIPRPPRANLLWRRVVALAGRLACPDNRFRKWAEAVGVDCGPLDNGEKEDQVTELDAVVAHLYGLTEGQLTHIFETFHEGWDCGTRLAAVLDHLRASSRKL
jgi:hypothetical protein